MNLLATIGLDADPLVTASAQDARIRELEMQLQERDKELHCIQQMTQVGMWHWTLPDDRVTWSTQLFEIFQRDPALGALPFAEQAQLYTEDSWARLQQAVTHALTTGTAYEIDLEHIRPDNRRSWLVARGAVSARGPNNEVQEVHGTVQDITERKLAEQAIAMTTQELQTQTAFLKTVIDNIPLAVFIKDARDQFRITVWNKAAEDIFEMPKEAVLGKLTHDLWPKADADLYLADDQKTVGEQRVLDIAEERVLTANRGIRWLHTKKVPLINPSTAQTEFLIGICEDITERKYAVEQLQLASMVYQHSSEAMMICDADNNIIAINAAFTQLTGYETEEVLGRNPRLLSSGRHDSAFHQSMWETLNSSGQWQGEMWNRRKNGECFAESLMINTIRHADGALQRYVALFSDITKKKASEELIWQQANFDSLTMLPNRRMLRDRLEQNIKKSKRDNQPLAILLIDLDHFKEVNDTLGHDMGDVLLVEAARRIRESIRESDTVARLGGDEFAVILAELDRPTRVAQIAQSLNEKLSTVFLLKHDRVFVSASIGITLYPNDGTEIEELLKHADQALYVAKDTGRNRFSYFTPALQVAALERMHLTNDLRLAEQQQQFRLYFQPIVHLASGRINKAEALIRWQHPTRGLIGPAEFIPLAETSGLIPSIGDWVFREAARWVKRWRSAGHPDFKVSINQSPLELLRDTHHQHAAWLALLKELDLPGESIVVEITENLLMDGCVTVTAKLHDLRAAGIQIALDDFGTGYSSLSYLKKFDMDYLKLDQSFTRNLAPGTNDMTLSDAIIVMAHKLGLQVIAEGIETEYQRILLLDAGCDYGQGYLFARPMSGEAFDDFLFQLKPQQQP